MGPAHCTSGATYCSAISSTLAWGRKVPSVRGVPREGCTRVLSVERLCTSREDLRTLLPFRPRAIWRLRLKARARSRSYTLHYSTCSTRRITHACVFTPHHFVSLLQSQSIAFAVQCRSFTPSLWTERSLNKSQNRQFTIITMYQVKCNPNFSRRTSLHWGRWLPGTNTPQYFVRVPCVDLDRSLRGRIVQQPSRHFTLQKYPQTRLLLILVE